MKQPALPAIALLSILAVTASEPGFAQVSSPQPGETALEEVQVSGERPGPGLWRVTQGSHTLYLMGTLTPLPKKMQWRSHEVESVLARAQAYIPGLPSVSVKAGPITAIRLFAQWRRARENPDGATLRSVLAPESWARFEALRTKYAPRERSLEERRPLLAAAKLYESAIEAIGLRQDTGVDDAVRKLARKLNVKVIEIKQSVDDPRGALDEIAAIPLQAELACFSATLARLESDLGTMRSRAEAWAVGDVAALHTRPAVAQESACWGALKSAPKFASLNAQFDAQWLAEAIRALDQNAVTLSAVPISRLLEDNGVLEQLRARGYEISAP